MKYLPQILTGFLVATWLSIFATGAVMAQEKAKAATAAEKTKQEQTKGQSTTKVRLDNEKFRVVETWAKPGEKNEMKARSDRVIYSVNAGKQRIHYSDGKTEEVEFKAGDVRYRKAETSQSENIGKTETHNLVITAK
jgi:uncharacterized RmlC-like cupin family protein